MPDKKLTVETSEAEFKAAYRAKSKLIKRQVEDFKFALGEQWSKEDIAKLKEAGFKEFTDNRIQPNIFLLTGLERQNRSDFKAFPEGEEDGLKAEIASALFKHSIKTSDFQYKASDQFKDGITCGESHLELYLDYTENLLNGKPCWTKTDGNCVFPEPGYREYDFSDARYVYKLKTDLSADDLISLYPKKKRIIEKTNGGKISFADLQGGEEEHLQSQGYNRGQDVSQDDKGKEARFDLLERYYKKWVEKAFVGDRQTGRIEEAESPEKAEAFISEYQNGIAQEQAAFQDQVAQYQAGVDAYNMGAVPIADEMGNPLPPPVPPIEPTQRDPERFVVIPKKVPEIWCFAHVPGMQEPLADERAWFYPKWKGYPIIPYFARFSTAPLRGDDRHLLIQGVVHGVKGAQEKHNKSEMLMLRHLNSSANSGWLEEEGSWVDSEEVKRFGTSPGVNLTYHKGTQKPERIFPMPLSQGHAQLSETSAESIKAQLGINADLLAAQDSSSSGRAIALRQRQGLLMIQELFDNLSRTKQACGRFLLSQLGEIYDTETAMKVLGEAFLTKNFPPPMILDPMGQQVPMPGPDGKPMQYDRELAEISIAEVLSGDLGKYDVSVGEAVASETMRMANAAEVKEIATAYPGLIPPNVLVDSSQLPQSIKNQIMSAIQAQQAATQAAAQNPAPPKKSEEIAA